MDPWVSWRDASCFEWKRDGDSAGYRNSKDMGLWVTKMPPVTKPEAKVEFVDIPGRSRYVTLSEGPYAFKPYLKEIVVTVPMFRHINVSPYFIALGFPYMTMIHEWLRGDGFLKLCTEEGDKYRYRAHIAGAIEFQPIAKDLRQATIPFYVQPDRLTLHETRFEFTSTDGGIDTSIDDDGQELVVQGNYPASLVVYVSRPGSPETPADLTVTFTPVIDNDGDETLDTENAQTMKFFDMKSGSCHVQCAAQICVNSTETELWTRRVAGDYWELKPGKYKLTTDIPARIIIHVNWRWV